jgi:hypothetical protein
MVGGTKLPPQDSEKRALVAMSKEQQQNLYEGKVKTFVGRRVS